MITTRQIDAGLALLGLNRSDLATSLGVNKSTLNAYFTGQTSVPSGRLAEIQKWLENAGIVFTEDEGVKLNKGEIVKYEGEQGFVSFMTDVLETVKRGDSDVCVSNVDENDFENNLPKEFAEHYRDELAKVKNFSSKILVKEDDNFLTADGIAKYRGIPANVFSEDATFYAFGDKLALLTFHDDSVQILSLHNKLFADSFRVMFNAVWSNHEVIK